jgi:hypothetical protein
MESGEASVNRSKAKGTWWETACVNWLTERIPGVRRKVLAGSADEGDLTWGSERMVIECKNVGSLAVPAWIREAEAEAANNGSAYGVVLYKVRGKGQVQDGVVAMSPETFVRLVKEAGLDS